MPQSGNSKSPMGVPLFWDTGENPPHECSLWFTMFKLTVTAKENLKVDKLLRIRPTAAYLIYPTMSAFEEGRENEAEDETRKRKNKPTERGRLG